MAQSHGIHVKKRKWCVGGGGELACQNALPKMLTAYYNHTSFIAYEGKLIEAGCNDPTIYFSLPCHDLRQPGQRTPNPTSDQNYFLSCLEGNVNWGGSPTKERDLLCWGF